MTTGATTADDGLHRQPTTASRPREVPTRYRRRPRPRPERMRRRDAGAPRCRRALHRAARQPPARPWQTWPPRSPSGQDDRTARRGRSSSSSATTAGSSTASTRRHRRQRRSLDVVPRRGRPGRLLRAVRRVDGADGPHPRHPRPGRGRLPQPAAGGRQPLGVLRPRHARLARAVLPGLRLGAVRADARRDRAAGHPRLHRGDSCAPRRDSAPRPTRRGRPASDRRPRTPARWRATQRRRHPGRRCRGGYRRVLVLRGRRLVLLVPRFRATAPATASAGTPATSRPPGPSCATAPSTSGHAGRRPVPARCRDRLAGRSARPAGRHRSDRPADRAPRPSRLWTGSCGRVERLALLPPGRRPTTARRCAPTSTLRLRPRAWGHPAGPAARPLAARVGADGACRGRHRGRTESSRRRGHRPRAVTRRRRRPAVPACRAVRSWPTVCSCGADVRSADRTSSVETVADVGPAGRTAWSGAQKPVSRRRRQRSSIRSMNGRRSGAARVASRAAAVDDAEAAVRGLAGGGSRGARGRCHGSARWSRRPA